MISHSSASGMLGTTYVIGTLSVLTLTRLPPWHKNRKVALLKVENSSIHGRHHRCSSTCSVRISAHIKLDCGHVYHPVGGQSGPELQ